MRFFRKKTILLSCSAVLAILLALAGTVFIKYRLCLKADLPIENPTEASLSPEGDRPLGSESIVSAVFKCPWHRYPLEAVLKPGKGAQSIGTPVIKLEKIRFGYCLWKVSASMQPYRTGNIPKGTLDVLFNKHAGAEQTLSLEVPSFIVTALNTGKSDELSLASRIESGTVKKSLGKWIFISAAIVIAGIIIFLVYFRNLRSSGRIILTPWGIALAELSELREKLKVGKIAGETCFTSLTDIVRIYLEKRFSLHAPTQTTYEFLQDLERSGSPLAENHKFFLKDFMTSADFVKFAKLPADIKLLDDAMDKAEKLVCETKPSDGEGKKK